LLDEAERVLERGKAGCQETGFRVHLRALLEVRAALADRGGRLRQARPMLRDAYRLYTDMGAIGDAERLAMQSGL
jgi:hypothetical protein